ncbi:MAG TPA: hypothetical protein VK465_11520 [Fibrobacteria bacterium]|nr:hypothetical protein [Fibrobacteria bacterium]
MSAHLDRASLIAMAVGLLLVGQPWVHALFVLGFPLLLVGIAAQGAAAILRANILRASILRARSGEGQE